MNIEYFTTSIITNTPVYFFKLCYLIQVSYTFKANATVLNVPWRIRSYLVMARAIIVLIPPLGKVTVNPH